MATSLWSVLEDEDEREEVDEPSHAERPLAPFLRPPFPPSELRPTAPVFGPNMPPRRRPHAHQHPMRCHPRGGGGGRHPHHFCCHPHGCGPRGRDCRCVAVSPGFVLPTLPPGLGQKIGSGSSSWTISRALTRARVGAALVCLAYGVQSTRVQGASTGRTSACHDAGFSDEKRAQAVSTTAVANADEKSTLGADAMHATMPLNKASFPGRGRWDATSCGRDEGEGAAVAPAAADATDWAMACCALFATRDASRAAVFACSISSSNRRRRAIVWLASSSARWARAAGYAKSKGAAWSPRSRELWGWRSVERGEPRWRRWCPVERGGGQLVTLPRGWRELASRRPRVRWGSVRVLLCVNWRVHPLGWWVRVEVWCSVFCLVTRTRLRWFPPSRVAGSRASSPCLVGIHVGVRGRPQPAPSSPLPHW